MLAVVILVLGTLTLILGGIMTGIWLTNRDPELRAQNARMLRSAAQNGQLIGSLYAEALRARDVNPVAAVFADDIERVYGTEMTGKHIKEISEGK